MSNWFECKIRYDKIQENGSIKNVKEPYLVDALSFTEAEARIINERTPFISGDFNVSAVKRTKIAEVFWDDRGDKWYLAKLSLESLDPITGAEKKTYTTILVQAKDFKTALENVMEGMGKTIDYRIISITETPLMDVYKVKLDKFTNKD